MAANGPAGVGPVRARSFDPNRVGGRECRAWIAYYRKEWLTLLAGSVGLVHAGFRMSWRRTLHGAWLVLRANQLWAPYPDNDPDGARRCMERFYRLVADEAGHQLDCAEAARREVEWWRVHREVQRGDGADTAAHREALVAALVAMYSFVYDAHPGDVRRPLCCGPRPWISPTAGRPRAATRTAPYWPRSARRWCGRTQRCSRSCIGSSKAAKRHGKW